MSTPDEAREELARIAHEAWVAYQAIADEPEFGGDFSDVLAHRLDQAGYRKQGPVTDAEVEAGARAYANDELGDEEWEWVKTQPEIAQPYLDGIRAALEAARKIQNG